MEQPARAMHWNYDQPCLGQCLRLYSLMPGARAGSTRRCSPALGVMFPASIIDHARSSSRHLFLRHSSSALLRLLPLPVSCWAEPGAGGLGRRPRRQPPALLSHTAALAYPVGITWDHRNSRLREAPYSSAGLPGLEMTHWIQEQAKLIYADEVRIVLSGQGRIGWKRTGGNFLGGWTRLPWAWWCPSTVQVCAFYCM